MPKKEETPLPADIDPKDREWIKAFERAEAGEMSALPILREAFECVPELAELFGGDVAKRAIDAVLNSWLPKHLAYQEAVRHKMAELRAELLGDRPSALERLLVERIVVCLLHAYHADIQSGNTESMTLKWAEYLQRQQDRAHRRYESAIKTLAAVRRLALPIKLNVSVAGTVETKPVKTAGGLPSRFAGAMSNN